MRLLLNSLNKISKFTILNKNITNYNKQLNLNVNIKHIYHKHNKDLNNSRALNKNFLLLNNKIGMKHNSNLNVILSLNFHSTRQNQFNSTIIISLVNLASRMSLISIPFFYTFRVFKKYPKFTFLFVSIPLALLSIMIIISIEYSKYGQRWRLVFNNEKSEVKEIKDLFDKYRPNLNINYDIVTEELLAVIRIIIFELLSVTGEFNKRELLNQKWEIIITDEDTIQAQVLSSGHIIITSETLKFIKSINELAFILAHEISHILYRHNAELRSLTDLSNNFLFVIAGIIDFVSSQFPKVKQILGPTLSNCSKGSLLYPYTRLQELEADKGAIFLMSRAGYNPNSSIKFWNRLLKEKEDERENKDDNSNLNKINNNRHVFNSHPDILFRIKFIESIISIVSPIYLQNRQISTYNFKDWEPIYKEIGWNDINIFRK